MDATDFWTWFDGEKDRIAESMLSGDQSIVRQTLNDVDDRLDSITEGVSFLYRKTNDGSVFVATASGNPEIIHNVKAVIESAPHIEGWAFMAFRPPAPAGSCPQIQMRELTLDANDITFQAFDLGEDGLGITLYPRGMNGGNTELYQQITITLMDHVIGEYDAMTLIDSLRVDPPSEIPDGTDTIPLNELRDFLHEIRGLNDENE